MGSHTEAQSRAIAAEGEVLVMAGAGAGKTSTLVARVLDRITRLPGRVSLDRVLVVTFNEAAAAEMRHRLQRTLEARLAESPGDTWIAEQVALLETAMVSTLHGFCLRLIREHFHELALDPQFAVQDPLQTRIVRDQVLGEVFREGYGGVGAEAERMRRFLGRHGADGDEPLRALVLRIHDYARSLPEGAAWIRHMREACAGVRARLWRGSVLGGVRRWAASWRGYAERLAAACPENFSAVESARVLAGAEGLEEAGVTAFLEGLRKAGDRGRFDKGQPGYRKLKAWREPLEDLFDETEQLETVLVAQPGGSDPLEDDWAWAREDMAAVLEMAERFESSFAAARRAGAVVDFTDLEQMALRLLWDAQEGRPTALAESWRGRIDQVLVDEYQDINAAQDRILRCLSREGGSANRFFVGDVKQSIYRFRLAAPAIFQKYAREWRTGEGRSVIALAENFRSHEAILGFVNELFSRVMRSGVGGVAYDAEARLLFGAAEGRSEHRIEPEGRVELQLVVRGDAANGDDERGASGGGSADEGGGAVGMELDDEEWQADVAARRLSEMRAGGWRVWDAASRALRPVQWKDMVVLHPAPGPVAERWARSFARLGVPLDARRGGFFQALEVADLVNVARMLDNPLQDLPVLAVLRSPMVGLGVNELAAVRLVDRGGRFWEAVERCVAGEPLAGGAEAEPEIRGALARARARLALFVKGFRRWQRLGRHGSVTRCLEAVLEETSYEDWLRAQPRAEARLANVRRLLNLTRQFDQAQRRGLYRFLRFVEQHQETGDAMETAPAASGDSVRLLSMHQSKGLEFPVVVAAGLGRKFNLRDLREEWLLDEEYGLCPPVLPPGRVRGYPSLSKWFAVRRELGEAVGEQARLFYVACTRAADRLVLVGSVRDRALGRWVDPAWEFTDREVARVTEPLGWLGPLIPALTGDPHWMESESGRGRWMDWRIHRGSPTAVVNPGGVASGTEPGDAERCLQPSAAEVRVIGEKLHWSYDWSPATESPAKTAVTALRREWAVDEEAAVRDPDVEAVSWARSRSDSRPASEDAVARGVAHHTFFQFLDLTGALSGEFLELERQRLVGAGVLDADSAALLDLEGVAAFWATPVGQVVRAEAGQVQRELPFTARLSRGDAVRLGSPGGGVGFSEDDFQVLQGVADLVLFRDGEIWVIDYKTDRIRPEEVADRAAAYAAQLRLYAHALSNIHRRPVTRRVLWFIHPRCLVETD